MVRPSISYLVSTYDAGHFLNRHLDDLLNKQTRTDFEVIIVNPNSPGSDDAVAKKWLQLDDRIQYIYHPERETYGCSWLRAWEVAKGEFVSNSNTDDYHHPTFTERMYNEMFAAQQQCPMSPQNASMLRVGPPIGFGYAGVVVLNEQGQCVGRGIKPRFNFQEYSHTCYGGPQLIWSNDQQFKNSLDWDLMRQRASEHISAFDFWLILYFMSIGWYGLSVQELLTFYTQRPNSIEHQHYGTGSTYESLASISEFFPHHFGGKLKKHKEFQDFTNLPVKEEWIEMARRGKV